MMRSQTWGLALFMLWSATAYEAKASVADEWSIEAKSAEGRYGAKMPYVRYDSDEASLHGDGAIVRTSTDWARDNVATQASRQSYVELPSNGSYVEWTILARTDSKGQRVVCGGRGVTMRFTMPDSSDGMGLTGSVDVFVNGTKVKTVNLTSYYMWQYFPSGQPSDTPGGVGCFAFDEVHFLLDQALQEGDKIRIQGNGSQVIGIDFLEIEGVPDTLEMPAGAVSVTQYGASTSNADNLAAFVKAVEAADKGGKIVYIPAGTWKLGGIWNIYAKDVKIMGAGIWYTNIQFTSDQRFGGGISGGNGSNGGTDDYCQNVEFCHMYLNSNLRSRYGEQAVYKCFMDVWGGGSVIHDIWEDHFECGFWLGDYNGPGMGYCDGAKIVNCRIRNNLADGVNFCQGTSYATVYNCNIRNCGDDGLAMWNNNGNAGGNIAKDETGNVFAYNTIDLGWRAGGIAIYGGTGHQIYNNYLCDLFMAAGIHLNTTFPGYAFDNCQGIQFDNNVLVRCGTNWDGWNEDLSAIDLKQNVKNITFNNTMIFDSPFDAVRIMTGPTNIVFNDTKIYGSGLSGQYIDYSSQKFTACAIRLNATNGFTFNNTEIRNVHADVIGNNTTWPIWTDNNAALAASIGYTLSSEDYITPGYPESDQFIEAEDPFESLTGYDVVCTGLSWQPQEPKEGDAVTFSVRLDNPSTTDIPAGAKIMVNITIDDTEAFTITCKDGLAAGAHVILTADAPWTASIGGHSATATVDPAGQMKHESNKENNVRTRTFNVNPSEGGGDHIDYVTGGYDLVVSHISYENLTTGDETIQPGDQLVFSATVVNAGDHAVPAGTVIGIQFQIDGNTSVITWSDSYQSGLAPHATTTLRCNGGTSGNSWTATAGSHTLTAWVDDINRLPNEVNEGNNKETFNLPVIPYGGIEYISNPTGPDDLDATSGIRRIQTESVPGNIYHIDGRIVRSHSSSLEGLPKGLYIVGGKKVYIP